MRPNTNKLKTLVGKKVYVLTRQGQVREGILHKIDRDKIYLHSSSKKASTKAFTPFFSPITSLALFDLLAIGESPFFFGTPFFF
ncbi:DUF2642 domain-containing protein [Paenibacillus ginsengarvi]|uniref:DUF2642 domain-containing protein n=1 Tax=Paenibacillus ginsengarvi TaxID=400777 RepID=A0A3B0BNL1_9BACL|nr:DUF2642 domain-containing protein [Paenibacillus ginsengarvi]RKN74983.1 DUF2642 domain-containing protein [Paenibacillus ginsengarvi]